MVSNNSGRLGPSEADGSGRDDIAGTPEKQQRCRPIHAFGRNRSTPCSCSPVNQCRATSTGGSCRAYGRSQECTCHVPRKYSPWGKSHNHKGSTRRNYLLGKDFRTKNSRPQAVKHGAGTDVARSTRQRGAAESEKRGNVNCVIGNPYQHLRRREFHPNRIRGTAPIPRISSLRHIP